MSDLLSVKRENECTDLEAGEIEDRESVSVTFPNREARERR